MDVPALRRQLIEVVGAHVPRGSRAALIDFPGYANAGDNALWAGERAYLAELDVDVVYACDHHGLSMRALRRAVGSDGIVLFHSGGNFGDLYPWFQHLREHVALGLPDTAMVQLPQTLQYADPANLERTRTIYERHGGLRLLLRDERSLRRAREAFALPSALCPDSAFALRPPAAGRAERDVLWLTREDAERTGERLLPPGGGAGAEVLDWLWAENPGDPGSTRAYRWLRHRADNLVRRTTRRPRGHLSMPVVLRLYDWIAEHRVAFACRLLSGSRVVVTDRLHGHVLCLLLGVPHVVVDTGYGKLSEFSATWGTAGAEVRFVADAEAARVAAGELLAVR